MRKLVQATVPMLVQPVIAADLLLIVRLYIALTMENMPPDGIDRTLEDVCKSFAMIRLFGCIAMVPRQVGIGPYPSRHRLALLNVLISFALLLIV